MKKKKKFILFIVCCCCFLLTLFLSSNNKVKADTSLGNYNYMYLVLIQEDSSVYQVRILYDYSTNHTYNNTIKYIDLSNSSYENFSGSVIVGTIYLGYGYISSDELILDSPYWCIPLNQYINSTSDLGYSTGYQVAQDYYQLLLDEQLDMIQQLEDNYNADLASIESSYQNTIAQKDATISQLTESLNSSKPSWGSFTGFLGTVFLFPIKFFKEAFNLDLFGVNVGSLIVGIGIIGIAITIITIILHGRSKKDE